MKKITKTIALAFIALAITAGTGCQKKSTAKLSLNVGKRSDSNSIDPIIDTARLEKLFEKNGLEVHFTGLPKSSLLNSVAVGKID